jgi:hypothetical protein
MGTTGIRVDITVGMSNLPKGGLDTAIDCAQVTQTEGEDLLQLTSSLR